LLEIEGEVKSQLHLIQRKLARDERLEAISLMESVGAVEIPDGTSMFAMSF
jgi:hypothetical protein